MTAPRKFSEKIALLKQKQDEGTAQFEQVMREVSDATKRAGGLPKQHLRITQTLGSFRGGSLPNVNANASNALATVEVKTDQPFIIATLEDFKKASGRGDGLPYRERGRSVGVGPMRSRPMEKRVDTSPYSSGPYLSPPSDSSWRRTNSDSALHQSAMCGDSGTPRRSHHHDSHSPDRRNHHYEGGLLPGIDHYQSQHEPGGLQIPSSKNTGSLPDLTCFHFQSPLSVPLDQEDPNTSPQGSSPQGGRFQFRDNRVPSPHTPASMSPSQMNRGMGMGFQQQHQQMSQQNSGFNQSQSPQSPSQSSCDDGLYSHLNVPLMNSSSFLHHQKVVTQDHSMSDGLSFQTSPMSPSHINCSLPMSPQRNDGSPQNSQQPSLASPHAYRSPQPARPSPQNSPSLQVTYRSASPIDSHHSAPPSPNPISPAGSPANHHNDAFFLQQHFEQFNMDWCQLVHTLVESGTGWSIQMDPPTTNYNSTANTQVMSPDDTGGQELSLDPGYYSTSPSQLHYPKLSTQQTTPQTPNTPSSIPDITLTDFSSVPDDLQPRLSSTGTSFDTDYFPSDESLREGLEPIDFDAIQILTAPPGMVIDPSAEDHFRLDRL